MLFCRYMLQTTDQLVLDISEVFSRERAHQLRCRRQSVIEMHVSEGISLRWIVGKFLKMDCGLFRKNRLLAGPLIVADLPTPLAAQTSASAPLFTPLDAGPARYFTLMGGSTIGPVDEGLSSFGGISTMLRTKVAGDPVLPIHIFPNVLSHVQWAVWRHGMPHCRHFLHEQVRSCMSTIRFRFVSMFKASNTDPLLRRRLSFIHPYRSAMISRVAASGTRVRGSGFITRSKGTLF